MSAVFVQIGAFLLAISLLITVHEWGHFWVARRLGVKVLRFSIGFGSPVLRWQRTPHSTEYVLALLPIGGYVKMLDEQDVEEPIAESDRPYAFNRQAVWKRMAIVVAGPVANFLFAFLIYWAILCVGEPGVRPVIGPVAPDSIAGRAGFLSGEQITAINQQSTPTWSMVSMALLKAAVLHDDAIVQGLATDNQPVTHHLPASELAQLDPTQDLLPTIGLQLAPLSLPPIIGAVIAGEPAAIAGLQAGDRILDVNEQVVKTWHEFTSVIRAHPEESLTLQIQRHTVIHSIMITPAAVQDEQAVWGRIGVAPDISDKILAEREVVVQLNPFAAALASWQRIADISVLSLRILGHMMIGQASLDNLTSPIGIAETAGYTIGIGLDAFIKFIALLSVSLGLLNLLPIPVLDGGHLLFLMAEAVRRRPLSESFRIYAQQVGLVILVGLMTLAVYMDLVRP
jgi:regulator of sigma E protease